MIIATAVLLDAATTLVGLALGLPEAGPVASRLLGSLGLAYFAVEAGVLYGVSRILEAKTRLGSGWARAIAAIGPWAAGWHNLALILRSAGVV